MNPGDRLTLYFLSATVTLTQNRMKVAIIIVLIAALSLGLSIDTFLSRFSALKSWVKGLFAKAPPSP